MSVSSPSRYLGCWCHYVSVPSSDYQIYLTPDLCHCLHSYFLLCGYTPFDRDDPHSEMLAIIHGDYKFEPVSRGLAGRTSLDHPLTTEPLSLCSSYSPSSRKSTGSESPKKPEPSSEDASPSIKTTDPPWESSCSTLGSRTSSLTSCLLRLVGSLWTCCPMSRRRSMLGRLVSWNVE